MPWKSRPVYVSDQQRQYLMKVADDQSCSEQERQRARIVLLLAAGYKNKDIADRLNVHENTVVKWRGRWTRQNTNPESILDSIALTGRPRSVLTDDKLTEVERAINGAPPEGKLRWTVRALAQRLRLPVATTQRALVELSIDLNKHFKSKRDQADN